MKKGIPFPRGQTVEEIERDLSQGTWSTEEIEAMRWELERQKANLASPRKDEPPLPDIAYMKHVILRHGGRGFMEPDFRLNDALSKEARHLVELGEFIRPASGQVVVVPGEFHSCIRNTKMLVKERADLAFCFGFKLVDGWWIWHAFAYSETTGHIFDSIPGDAYFAMVATNPDRIDQIEEAG